MEENKIQQYKRNTCTAVPVREGTVLTRSGIPSCITWKVGIRTQPSKSRPGCRVTPVALVYIPYRTGRGQLRCSGHGRDKDLRHPAHKGTTQGIVEET